MQKKVLQELYCAKKLSVAEIAQKLNETFPKTLYWVKKHKIPIRSYSERAYVKYNKQGNPFDPKKDLGLKDRELLSWGLALYWAEGSRKERHSVQLGNLDHRLLQIFMKFLREIARVDESRLRVFVRVFHEFDQQAARRYWSQLLSISLKQVHVYPHGDRRSRRMKQWSRHGLTKITVSNTKLKAWMDQQLEENINALCSHWGIAGPSSRKARRKLTTGLVDTSTYSAGVAQELKIEMTRARYLG